MSPSARLLLISTGGTIAMTRSAPGEGIVPSLSADDLVDAVEGLREVAEFETLSPFRIPSASLTLDDLVALARLIREGLDEGAEGAVVVQGTDTIEETAFALACLLRTDKPVVVTGAMRGPEAPGADGPANLLAAATVAAAEAARGLGVLVVLNDEIHSAMTVQKSHTALPSAFQSPGTGPIGLVAEGRARILARPALAPPVLPLPAGEPPAVALLRIGLDDDGRILEALPALGFAGVVIEGMGAGHVPAGMAGLVSRAVQRLPVVLASRVAAGPVFERTYGFAGSETDLLARGAVRAGPLSGLKARVLLRLLLADGAGAARIADAFARLDA